MLYGGGGGVTPGQPSTLFPLGSESQEETEESNRAVPTGNFGWKHNLGTPSPDTKPKYPPKPMPVPKANTAVAKTPLTPAAAAW
eukprot:1478547-Heterocapsa_arctica.AAC.1